MRKVISALVVTLGVIGSVGTAHAQMVDEVLKGVEAPEHSHTEMGIITAKDNSTRTVVVNGTRYMVGNNNQTPVTLYGTSAGAYELLDIGMAVEVEYYDFGDKGRAAIRITGLNPDDVEVF